MLKVVQKKLRFLFQQTALFVTTNCAFFFEGLRRYFFSTLQNLQKNTPKFAPISPQNFACFSPPEIAPTLSPKNSPKPPQFFTPKTTPTHSLIFPRKVPSTLPLPLLAPHNLHPSILRGLLPPFFQSSPPKKLLPLLPSTLRKRPSVLELVGVLKPGVEDRKHKSRNTHLVGATAVLV